MAQLPDSIVQRHKQQDETIKLDKEGNWYHGEYPILHDRTVSFFHKNIARDKSGQYYLTGEDKPIHFEVEDVPYFVKKIEKTIAGFLIYLTDDSIELLDPASLGVGVDNAIYCLIKGGEYTAKFFRTAYMELSKFIIQEGRDFILQLGSKKHIIKPGKPQETVEFEDEADDDAIAKPTRKAAVKKVAPKSPQKQVAKKAAVKKEEKKATKPKKKADKNQKSKVKAKAVKKSKPKMSKPAKKAKPAKKKKK